MAWSDEKEARLRGLLALHENENFRSLLSVLAAEESALTSEVFSEPALTHDLGAVLLRYQQIGQVRGMRRLPELMLAEIESLRIERQEREETNDNPA